MPRILSSHIDSTTGERTIVDIVADLPWPAGSARVFAEYVQEKLPGGIFSRGVVRSYSLAKGDVDALVAYLSTLKKK